VSGTGDVGGGCDSIADSTFFSGLACGLTYKVVSLPHSGHFTLLPDKNSSVANSMFTPQCSHGHFAIMVGFIFAWRIQTPIAPIVHPKMNSAAVLEAGAPCR
jgi:hypothetical protein